MSNYHYTELPRWTGAEIPHDGQCERSKGIWSKPQHAWIGRLYKKARTCPGCDQWIEEQAFLAIRHQAREDGHAVLFLWRLCTTESELKTARERLRQQRQRSGGTYAVLQDPEEGSFLALTTWDQQYTPPQPLDAVLEGLLLEGWRVESTSRSWGRAKYGRRYARGTATLHGTLTMVREDYVREFEKVGFNIEIDPWGEEKLVPDPAWEQEVRQWQERYAHLSPVEFLDTLPTTPEELIDGRILYIADKVREAYGSAA